MKRTLLLLSAMALALLLASGLALVAISPAARADGDCQPSGSQVVCTFSYTGAAQSWTVPDGVSQATFEVHGAQGGSSGGGQAGGLGGKASATIALTPDDTLQINVGGAGSRGVAGTAGGAGGTGGFNGGAAGGNGLGRPPGGLGDRGGGGGGGGASDVRSGGDFGLANRIIVGGGGGGAGDFGGEGGFGGGSSFGPNGGSGGDGGNGSSIDGGFGGSGGFLSRGGFGGGSGFGSSGVVFQSGVRSGNGLVTITYTPAEVDLIVNNDEDTDDSACNTEQTDPDCTLREAIDDANASAGAATITFDLDSPATITLDSVANGGLGSLPPITDSAGLTIDGGDAEITVSGGGAVRVFEVGNGKKLALENLTVSGGSAAGEDPIDERGGGAANFGGTLTISNSTFSGNSAGGTSSGGGVYTTDRGTVNVTDSTFLGNSAVFGGGIYNQNSSTTVTNSTFSDNSAAFGGGGGGIDNSGTLTVNNSTFSGNSGGAGGGIGNFGTATLKNTIVAGNSAEFGGPDVNGTFTSEGYNLIGKSDGSSGFTDGQNGDQVGTAASPLDPKLGPLADNGGHTLTHALLAGSPAVDKGNTDLTEDQRGQPRPFDDPNVAPATGGDNSDIGSFEVQEVLNTAPDAKDDSATTSEDDSVTIHVLANDTDPESDALQITSVSTPSHGTATINNNATPSNTADDYVDYDPVDNYNGTDTFTYTISDGQGGTDTANVNVTVNPVNDTPVANDNTTTYTMAEDSNAITIDFGALVSDLETPSDANLTYNITAPPEAQGSVSGTGSTRTFDSADDFNGTVDIFYTVTDRGDPDDCSASPCDAPETSAQKKVSVTVIPVNDPPSANAQSLTTNEDINKVITLAGNDIDGDTLSYKITSLPTNGKLRQGTTEITSADLPFSLSSNQVTYDPNDNYNNTAATADAFDFKVNDGNVDSAAAAKVSITVTPENDTPTVAMAAGGSCGTNDRSGQINLTVNDPDGPAGSLTLSASSSNQALVPTSNVTFGVSSASRTLTATAVSGRTSTAVLTVKVSDDGGTANGGKDTGTVEVTVKVDGNGSKTINGTEGTNLRTDMIFGQNGNDVLKGLDGNDLLCGGRGNDTLTGDVGADHFGGGQGTDTATDFSAGDSKDGTIERTSSG